MAVSAKEHGCVSLGARCAMPGTDIAYAATRNTPRSPTSGPYVSCYASVMRCPVCPLPRLRV
eukprot:1173986-Rhodomonas_salina.2